MGRPLRVACPIRISHFWGLVLQLEVVAFCALPQPRLLPKRLAHVLLLLGVAVVVAAAAGSVQHAVGVCRSRLCPAQFLRAPAGRLWP
eukprot:9077112-Alexandrium_andersonii.AAC.1